MELLRINATSHDEVSTTQQHPPDWKLKVYFCQKLPPTEKGS